MSFLWTCSGVPTDTSGIVEFVFCSFWFKRRFLMPLRRPSLSTDLDWYWDASSLSMIWLATFYCMQLVVFMLLSVHSSSFLVFSPSFDWSTCSMSITVLSGVASSATLVSWLRGEDWKIKELVKYDSMYCLFKLIILPSSFLCFHYSKRSNVYLINQAIAEIEMPFYWNLLGSGCYLSSSYGSHFVYRRSEHQFWLLDQPSCCLSRKQCCGLSHLKSHYGFESFNR